MKTYIHLFILCLLITACTPGKRNYVIGVSQCSEDNWRDKLNGELKQGYYYYDNIELKIVSADDNDRKQVAQIDSLVASGIDLLIVSPNQKNTVTSAIDRAYDKGIPVILFDRRTESGKYTAFIGADNYKVGQSLGKYVLAMVKDKPVNVLEIQGLRGSSPTTERHRGFADAVKDDPNINIIASPHAGWLQDEARKQTDSVLNTRTDIDIVFAQNDRMALGAREAIEKRGIRRDITYLGVDALATPGGGMEAIHKSKIAASYLYPTRGDLVMQLAMNILEGKPYERDNHLKATLVTPENVEQLLMQNEEMELQTERLETVYRKVDSYLTQYNQQKMTLVLVVTILALTIALFVYIYRSIAQKRRMAEETADAKLQFFTNVSHEFRTPLTLIADPIERLLEDENLSIEQRRLLNMAGRNVKVVLRLVREILNFRKTQKGKMALHLQTFNLRDSLTEWTEGFIPAIEKHGINFHVEADASISMTADPGKMESIVYNLLSNAIKYTPRNGEISLSAVLSEGNVIMRVSDNGAGIPADSLRQVFDRFFQADNSIAGGTGIGLAVVRSFVELHGGKVTVDSKEGKGTTFTVTIPAVCEASSAIEETTDDDCRQADDPQGMTFGDSNDNRFIYDDDVDGDRPKILVVDDNEDVRAYVASVLSPAYETIEAADGHVGLEMATHKVPDLIVCDVMMPVMDGLEMCRRLKSETATSHIPVILLTAQALDGQRAEGYDCGADAYITKPFSSKLLLARVRNLLEANRRLRERYSSDDFTDGKPQDADSRFIASLREKIKANIENTEFSVETLSSEMGLSRVQLYRKVKAITGFTPVEFIRIQRLQRAQRLLKGGSKTVSEVSYAVGFSSPSYFSKCFKEYFGKLPGEL